MNLPDRVKGYKISGELVQTLNKKKEFYTIAMNPRQALDRFYSLHGTFSEKKCGEAKVEVVPLNNIPQDKLEDLAFRYYHPSLKQE